MRTSSRKLSYLSVNGSRGSYGEGDFIRFMLTTYMKSLVLEIGIL